MIKSYYKAQKPKLDVGPGAYDIKSDMGNKSFYMGQKLNPISRTQIQSSLNLANAVNKLSTCPNENAAVRLKT